MMDLQCQEFARDFFLRANSMRVPISCSLEISKKCNLRCVHCYNSCGTDKSLRPEMSTEKIISVVDELEAMGCLMLLITGGEPLLRPDFREIYVHAKKKGMLVSVFSNGTIIPDDLLVLFQKLPPRDVEISLYGSSQNTYESITGVPGSFDSCIKGIESLLSSGVSVRLKTVLTTLNSDDFEGIVAKAESYGVPFRFDPIIFPRFSGDTRPLELRVDANGVKEKEFRDRDSLMRWRKGYEDRSGFRRGARIYACGAGERTLYIDACGYMFPCIMTRNWEFDLFGGTVAEGWAFMKPIRDKKSALQHGCSDCEAIAVCGYCPGLFYLENGDDDIPSGYICSVGKMRYHALL